MPHNGNTEVAICFKQAPYAAFQDTPDEGISLQFEVKPRGAVIDLAPVKMDFQYSDRFPKEPNVGYERLLSITS